jgi:peptide-methionine (S)-S-oxide reductase
MRRMLTFLALAAAITVGALDALRADEPATPTAAATKGELAVATFAAGCFWCVESDFDKVDGVVETISGFTGGHTKNPTYGEVGQGQTGHAEAVQLKYDPKKVSYEKLLDYYWHHVDLVDGGGQFCDRGNQYRPAIFTHTDEQKALAEASKAALAKSGRFKQPIAVEIVPASAFTPAEEYHQDYYKKNSLKYRYYRYSCGRDARIATLWGDADAGH